MSHIFDALQRSAAERSGGERPPLLLATELLQAFEREAVAERERAAVCQSRLECEFAVEGGAVTQRQATATGQSAIELPVAAELPTKNASVDQFSHFQSLRVLAPPESRVVCLTDPESLAAEKFRFLGVRLRQLQQKRPLKKVLITSTAPQEGKSAIAANLACTLAQRQKTLLLEGDLRRPCLARLFNLGKLTGVSEWLKGERRATNSIYYLEGLSLWILPAGSTPTNPLELMQSGNLSAIMDQLSTWFDWIVIDSPPVLPLGDTSIWMRLADGIVLVTRQGTTEKEQLQQGIETIESAKLLGALLNCSTNTAHSEYYYRYASRAVSQPTVRPKK